MLALEETFGAPVIESYGMTEAAHQMASQPAAAGARASRARSASPPGPLVRICDEAGRFLPAGAEGEVVISGPNVTPGYEANPTPTPRASSRPRAGAGSAPATRASWTRRATCASPAG